MNPVRAILAVLAGIGLYRILVALLETTLVGAMADGPVTNEVEYFAVRNRPSMLVAALGYHSVAAFLAGYISAKIAGAHELMHAGVVAAVLCLSLVWDAFTPVWVRVALVPLIGPSLIAGAMIRRKAKELRS